MASSFNRIDHIVILAENLDRAIATYRRLGFTVTPGGAHPGGTHNALVPFQDGTYLELIAFQEPERSVQASEHRWYPYLSTGGGIIDFCLDVDDVAAAVGEIGARGLDYRGPVPGARTRLDGAQVSWRLGQPPLDRTGELPFFIDDITERAVRVPGDEAAIHANGVVGVRAIVIAVRDLAEATDLYGKLLDQPTPPHAAEEAHTADAVIYRVGDQQIMLAYPSGPDSPLVERIQRRGDGPYEIVMLAEGLEEERLIGPEEADGARILIQPA
ncbi:MAG TPA: VOC family protein [Thermomicrobiaceae bacterium]|nr:VOC family protein [Thermomicrobiaceae bacterium]